MFKWIHKLFKIPEEMNPRSEKFIGTMELTNNFLSCSIAIKSYELTIIKHYGYYRDEDNREFDHQYHFHYIFYICEEEETMDQLVHNPNVEDIVKGLKVYLDIVFNYKITYEKKWLE